MRVCAIRSLVSWTDKTSNIEDVIVPGISTLAGVPRGAVVVSAAPGSAAPAAGSAPAAVEEEEKEGEGKGGQEEEESDDNLGFGLFD